MPNELLIVLARTSKQCCPFHYLESLGLKGQELNDRQAGYLADRLGVTKRTVYNWNSRIRRQVLIACVTPHPRPLLY